VSWQKGHPLHFAARQIRGGVYGDETKAAPRSGMILEQFRAAHVCLKAHFPVRNSATTKLTTTQAPAS
jgi:hypothetical protein